MSISAALSAIAKYVFPDSVPHAYYKQNPGFMDSQKKTDAALGESYRVAVSYSQGAVGSANYTTVNTIASTMLYQRFAVTSVTDYALARMNGEDYEKLSGNEGAMVDAWKDRVDGAYQEAIRSLAIQYFGTGTGSRGIVSSGQATATITLGTAAAAPDPSRISNFYAGMYVTASATDGSALRNAGNSEIVAGVDRSAGTLTSTNANWQTSIAALAAGDFLYRRGDELNGGSTNVTFTGMGTWVVGGSSPAALFGATRTVDPVALAGTVFAATGVDMAEAVLQLCQLVSIQDQTQKTFYCHPRDKVNLVKLLESRARYIRPEHKDSAQVGVDTIEFETDSGPVKLKGDVNVPATQAFLLATDFCDTISVGKTPKPLEKDGQLVRARDAFDAYEMRIGTYGNFANRFPGACGRMTGWGA